MNPFIDDSRLRYRDRLREREQARLAVLARGNRAGWRDGWRMRIGDLLIALGQYMKTTARPAAQFD